MRIISSIRSLLLVLVIFMGSGAAFAQIGIAITLGPPALPVYEQPPCPADGLSLDAWVLGLRLRFQRLLLGSRRVGGTARSWFPMDPWLLGLGRRPVYFP
jgi:hypothetical protein